MKKESLSINSENILPIIKKWLYSSKDIFLRELLSNSSDAIEKQKYKCKGFSILSYNQLCKWLFNNCFLTLQQGILQAAIIIPWAPQL